MSVIKSFDLINNNLNKELPYNINNIKKVILNNSEELLGLYIIKENFSLEIINYKTDTIECLCYDESYQLVLLEFRLDKYSHVVRNSFMMLDDIKNNPSKIKVMLMDYLNQDIVKNLNMNPRIIVLGEDFNEYDKYAISQMPYTVDMIKVKLFNNNLVLEKIYEARKENIINRNLIKNYIFEDLNDFILNLGDEVEAIGSNYFVSYKRIKNFLYIILKDNIIIKTKDNVLEIKCENDLAKAKEIIIKAYEEI